MKQLISLFTAFFLLPTGGAFAQQQFGGEYYQHSNRNSQQQWLCLDGDTVKHDGQVLTNNLCVGAPTCAYVQSRGGTCDYIGWDQGARTHHTRSINNSSKNWNNQRPNPGWNNNQNLNRRPWNGGGGCIYKDRNVFISIPC